MPIIPRYVPPAVEQSIVMPMKGFEGEDRIKQFLFEQTFNDNEYVKRCKPLTPIMLRRLMQRLITACKENLVDFVATIRRLPICECAFCRQSSLLHHSEAFSAYLLEWPHENPGTEVHDHGDSKACVYVVDGTIKETVYNTHGKTAVNLLEKEQVLELDVPYIHKFECADDCKERAFSLHLYSPPLEFIQFYKRDGEQLAMPREVSGQWKYEEENPRFCKPCGRVNLSI